MLGGSDETDLTLPAPHARPPSLSPSDRLRARPQQPSPALLGRLALFRGCPLGRAASSSCLRPALRPLPPLPGPGPWARQLLPGPSSLGHPVFPGVRFSRASQAPAPSPPDHPASALPQGPRHPHAERREAGGRAALSCGLAGPFPSLSCRSLEALPSLDLGVQGAHFSRRTHSSFPALHTFEGFFFPGLGSFSKKRAIQEGGKKCVTEAPRPSGPRSALPAILKQTATLRVSSPLV